MTFEQYIKKYDELIAKKDFILYVMIALIDAGNIDGMETVKNGEYEKVWDEIRKLDDEYFNKD